MSDQVHARIDQFSISISPLQPPDPNPAIPAVGYRAIYPYTWVKKFHPEPVEREMDSLILENTRLKLQLLPGLGGRVWQTVNKANGLQLFHTPPRIGLVNFGLRGAWYTGGVEFNFPKGHSVSNNETVPAAIRYQDDGSASIFVGCLDLIQRVTWSVGIRLQPNSSSIYFDVFLFNRSSLSIPYMWWINAGVEVDEELEYVNDTTEVVSHFLGRRDHLGEIINWPIHKNRDLRLYQEYVEPSSFFHLAGDDKWFGFYNHNEDNGIVRIGNSSEAPGLKIWNSGQAEEGYLWGKFMTGGERYTNSELQSGRPETQMDYDLLPAHFAMRWTEIWRPVWGLGGVDCASESVALSLNPMNDKSELRLLGDQPYPDCEIHIDAGEIYTYRQDISADNPSSISLPIPADTDPLSVEVFSKEGQRLLSYRRPIDRERRSIAAEVLQLEEEPSEETRSLSTEELAIEAKKYERFNFPSAAEEFARKVISKDPGHIDSNLILARINLRKGNFPQAREHCKIILFRDPHYEWAHYLFALAFLWEGNKRQAEVEFERAAGRSYHSSAACWFHLGEIYTANKEWEKAIYAFDRCLEREPHHVKAIALKASAWRHAGKLEQGAATIEEAAKLAPLDPFVRAELWLADSESEISSPWTWNPKTNSGTQYTEFRPQADLIQDALEAAFDYLACDLYIDARKVLEATLVEGESNPMALYSLGYTKMVAGNVSAALVDWGTASKLSGEYIYSFRREERLVLEAVILNKPKDGLAHVLLGMLELSHRNPERALAVLQIGSKLRPEWDQSFRLMAISHQLLGDTISAFEKYWQAIEVNPFNPRLYVELDDLLLSNGADLDDRERLWSKTPAEILNDDHARGQYARALAHLSRYSDALKLLAGYTFFPEEGSSEYRDLFSQIQLSLALEAIEDENLESALVHAKLAYTYPENLGIATPYIRYDAASSLLQGIIFERLGQEQKAQSRYEEAANEHHREINQSKYYSGLALLRLNKTAAAEEQFHQLLSESERILGKPERDHQYAHFLSFLGRNGIDRIKVSHSKYDQQFPKYRWEASISIRIAALSVN